MGDSPTSPFHGVIIHPVPNTSMSQPSPLLSFSHQMVVSASEISLISLLSASELGPQHLSAWIDYNNLFATPIFPPKIIIEF